MRQTRSDYQRRYLRGAGYWKQRERNWAKRGIVEADGEPLRAVVYIAVLELQKRRCALSGVKEGYCRFAADHDVETGLFRGILSADANHHALGTFERFGHYRNADIEDEIREYLEFPPYQQWLAKTGGLPRHVRC